MTTEAVLALLMFLTLLIFILVGFPVAFTLGGVAIIFGLIGYAFDIFHFSDFGIVSYKIFDTVQKTTLMAVPLFAFMGIMLEKSGLAQDLLETTGKIFAKLKGGLFFSVLIVGMLLAASTGIIGATVITMTVIALPTMIKHKYDANLSCGIIAASGTLGQIIPPSIILILLGDIMQVDVATLFVAAIFPGLMLVSFYALYIFIRTYRNPSLAPKVKDQIKPLSSKEIFTAIIYPGLLISLVLGTIILGIATPTEAASCGAVGSIAIAFIRKKCSKEIIRATLTETTKITTMVFTILICAQFFGIVFRGLNGDEFLKDFLSSNFGPNSGIIMIMLLMFVLGFFLDFLEICFIVIPIVYPIFLHFVGAHNLSLTWISILIAMNLQTSFLTPPFGFALFYLRGSAPPEIKTGNIYKGVIPFIGLQILAICILYIFPDICLWLPDQIFDTKKH